jgi:ribonuclease E
VLIPNIHVETPNYNILRVKHDEVNDETNRASYKMVELPAETNYILDAAEEAKAIRPVAAVKGITPVAPAPIVAEKVAKIAATVKVSLMSRIKSWFGSATDADAVKKTEEANSESNRNNRNRNRNRNERNRGERADKVTSQERPNRNNEAKTQDKRAVENKPQEPRQPKPAQVRNEPARNESARNPNQQPTPAQINITGEVPANDATTEQKAERSGRRNRNNRRGRRDRDDSVATDVNRPFVPNEEVSTSQSNAAPEIAPVIPATVEVNVSENKVVDTKVSEVLATDSSATPAPKAKSENKKPKTTKTASNSRTKTTHADQVSQDVEVKSDAVEIPAESSKVAAKADNKRPTRSRKPKAESKPADLAASGLQLVETKADAPKAAVAAEAGEPRAPRKAASWQNKAQDAAGSEPLVMVETQNK